MQKLTTWFKSYWLTAVTLFLLAFIPLYPKLPLVDIKNTWVYIRLEDFVILFVFLTWAGLLLRGKVSLKTPLTMPILLFFLAGGIATFHSILLIYPTVSDIFPNVSFLSFIRRMEYMSLFFIAYSAVRDRKILPLVITTLALTVLAVSLYGIGQKYAGFPAYLTMNEEFAKGQPLRLSGLSRVSSTFGGHYDLAAYLVLIIPIFAALVFGLKNIFLKFIFAAVASLGTIVLFMTVSRISFFALVVSLTGMLFFLRRKLLLLLIPAAVVGMFLFVSYSPGLLDRFTSTVKTTDVLVDAESGGAIGHVKLVPNTYFEDKTVHQQFHMSLTEINRISSPAAAFVIPYTQLPETVVLLSEPSAPTGEDLPAGTGYINLTLSPNTLKIGEFLYEPKQDPATTSAQVYTVNGEYLVKQAAAYDLSFTTRFQGEWPKAIAAFKKNIFFGSGYGSVSLAVDNSYLRMLGETGLFGVAAFLSVFLVFGLYLVRSWPKIDSPLVKYTALGFAAGVAGLSVNAVFIDVFEASKVAFVLWLLTGIVMGLLRLYHRTPFHFYREIRAAATSNVAIALYLTVFALFMFTPMIRNYFVADDFTWLRWAADCGAAACPSVMTRLAGFMTDAGGFFYRPGTKMYFLAMYRTFWLNPEAFHTVSLVLHIISGILVFFLARRVLKSKWQAALSAFLFLVLSAASESVFWISATGHLAASCLMLLGLLSYISWRDTGRNAYLVSAAVSFMLSVLFHEMGIVMPLLFLLYEYTLAERPHHPGQMVRKFSYWLLALPGVVYALLRISAGSHWFSGDYSYNILKFPINAAANYAGYFLTVLAGPAGLSAHQAARGVLRTELPLAALAIGVAVVFLAVFARALRTVLTSGQRRAMVFGLLFAAVALLPFLGLGNITLRYSYLASAGFVLVLVTGLHVLYRHIVPGGRDIALAVTGILAGTISLWHVVAIQGLHGDWYHAGRIAQRFIISIDEAYENYWATSPMELNFVSVPIRHGDAWVFPVGLEDALWFVFRNPEIMVASWNSREEALEAVPYGSETEKVFVFTQEGSVWEAHKQLPGQNEL